MDWRLNGNFKSIIGNKFKWQKFKSTLSNDHEHCYFCWIKITDIDINEEHLSSGFVTISKNSKQKIWVCEKCFKDFKEKFSFEEE